MKSVFAALSAAVVTTGLTMSVAATTAHAIENVKILVPANPGGGWDQTGRALAAAMQSAKLVKSVRIDNRGGAGGTIGIAQFVNSAKGDPEAIMVGGLVMVGAIELNKSPVTMAQVTPVARLTAEYDVIVVPGGSRHRTLKDLLDAFKANSGAVAWGGGSAGGVDHILVGLLAKEIGANPAKINYVPYAGGGEAVAAILGGHVAAGVSGYGEFQPHIKSGKMRALAISSAARLKEVPDLPTIKEQGVNVEVSNWRGVFGAPGITEAQRNDLTQLIVATVKTPAWQEALKKNDWSDVLQTGDAFRTYIDAETRRVGTVLKEIGLAKP
jgi:putative tricarboxylic transport membrane protein